MKAAVQILKKTEDLKQKLSGDILNDNEAWNNHQQLQDLYQQLLVTDLEYSLDKKVEQDLWNYGFKNQINLLQMKAKDRKNPQRSDCQESLGWFLEAATGFYLQLLEELCEAFDLDIPCRRKNSVYGMMRVTSHSPNDFNPPMKTSCLYICQHCLVHLGDIARYRNHALQAETFYKHAAELVPSNGQPYNQLAILEAAKGDKLCTVFYYVRSIAVKCPFPVSATNLQKMFSKMANDDFQYEGKSKLSVYDYIVAFLQFHSLLHLTTGLDKAQKLLKILSNNLTVLIATESLSAWKLIQMTAINVFAAAHANRSLDINEKEVEEEILTEDEQLAYNLVLELIASTLNGLLLLVYTFKEDTDLKSYYVLPVIKLILDWLKQDLNHLKASAFTSKLQIWPGFCKLLNSIQSTQMPGFDRNKFSQVPLPEDWDLQCFLPFHKAHTAYKFKRISPVLTSEEEHSLRVMRLLEFGRWMCEQEIYGVELMTIKSENDDGTMTFDGMASQVPTGEMLKQLEELALHNPGSCNSQDDNIEVSLSNGISAPGDNEGSSPAVKMSTESAMKLHGSSLRERKSRPNVALQTIMQKKSPKTKSDNPEEQLTILKLKSESKQVTFKTPSPSPPASSSGTPPLPYVMSLTPSPVCQTEALQSQIQIKKKVYGGIHTQHEPHVDVNKMYQGLANPDVGHQFNYSYFGGGGEVRGHLGAAAIQRLSQQPHLKDIDGHQLAPKMMLGGGGGGGNVGGVNSSSVMFGYSPSIGQSLPPPPIAHNQGGNHLDMNGSSLFGGQQQWPAMAPPVGIEHLLSQMSLGQLLQQPPPPPVAHSQAIPNVGAGSSNRVYQNQTFAAVQRPQFNQETLMYPPALGETVPYPGLSHQSASNLNTATRSQQRHMEQQQRNQTLDNYSVDDRRGKLGAGNNMQNTYSLFNSPWSSGLNVTLKDNEGGNVNASRDMGTLFQPGLQSLWSGPGPSPLERLLEQQKQKEPAPH